MSSYMLVSMTHQIAHQELFDNMLSLKSFIEKTLPQWKVCVSNVVKRPNKRKVTLTVNKVNEHLSALQLNIVDNSNIIVTGLNRGGLHLNETGMGKLAVNFILKIRLAWKTKK